MLTRLFLLIIVEGVVMAKPAEVILRGGEVWTGDPARPRAQAVAVSGGKIVAVGADADVAKHAGPKTRVIELNGRAVVPALTDAHAHLVGLGLAMARADLRGCDTPAACAERARAAPGAWALGRGWDQNRFADRQFPTHQALDRALGDRPAWLRRIDGHAGWANAAALRQAGITRHTPDPPGGRILRDGRGEPTGVLVDHAMELVERVIPPATAEELEQAILRAQDAVLKEGLTEVHDMGLEDASLEAYRRLDAAGRLRVRVRAFADASIADRITAGPAPKRAPGERFALVGIKLYSDGALGSRGAALLEPYADEPDQRGLTLTPPERLAAVARAALRRGWQVAVHAIGDRANREVLDAFERAGVKPRHRFRVEHAQVIALADLPRFKKLGAIASMQPTHATSDMAWAEARLGPARLPGAYAWRRFTEAGVALAFGSDFPVEDASVVAGLKAAVERGNWTVDQRLTLDEALRAFSAGAAFAAFEERWRGRAAVGQAADLTVFDRPLAGLTDAQAELTLVGGQVVFERAAAR